MKILLSGLGLLRLLLTLLHGPDLVGELLEAGFDPGGEIFTIQHDLAELFRLGLELFQVCSAPRWPAQRPFRERTRLRKSHILKTYLILYTTNLQYRLRSSESEEPCQEGGGRDQESRQ